MALKLIKEADNEKMDGQMGVYMNAEINFYPHGNPKLEGHHLQSPEI